MTLNDYLQQYHNGCKASMARSLGRKPQHVTKMFRSPEKWVVVVEDGQHLICQIRAVCRSS